MYRARDRKAQTLPVALGHPVPVRHAQKGQYLMPRARYFRRHKIHEVMNDRGTFVIYQRGTVFYVERNGRSRSRKFDTVEAAMSVLETYMKFGTGLTPFCKTGKIAYATKADAVKARLEVHRKKNHHTSVYHCSSCNWWHLKSNPKRVNISTMEKVCRESDCK